ncbi:ABC transporter substrate-binding protein [Geobacter sp. SVR]|uniref:ABC transporter substrate-binding protein n=1 Tax=Geobacter sp. SVR TaxID=2495594 RepID=UPI00143EF996|nr:ABC transporter substrate binding protein [Geobacter sp. SVR]BCS53009.1 hypothetical protein GSVR_13170 [Geobacter sp. SVR]GCF84394.1 hypothetical protein GSbR_09940 [Geobacter sp. SVR]
MRGNIIRNTLLSLMVLVQLLAAGIGEAADCRVMVVMSYEETFPWVREQKEGIDSVLGGTCDIRYFYMNTKTNFAGGPDKARQAYALYQEFKPHGIIAADDDAQSMFVVPYLKDKVSTPVMFCGVNAEPEQYGYPASNVSGILERLHLSESIALARQLAPSIKSIGFIMRESPVAALVFQQVRKEADSYPVKVVDFKTPSTLKEAVTMTAELRRKSDLLFVETLEGITDEEGKPMKDREVMPIIARMFGKSTIGTNAYAVEYALLSAVIKTGQEQGSTAATMLRKAMAGTPAGQIPIGRNRFGKRMINLTVMKSLGMEPKPIILRGVELVRTREN